MIIPEEGSRAFHYLLVAALVFILIIGIKTISYVINILVIAVILMMLALPVIDWLVRRRVPYTTAVGLVVLGGCLILLALFLMVLYSGQVLVQDMPLYQAELNARLSGLFSQLNSLGLATGTAPTINIGDLAPALFTSLMQLGDFLMYLFFIAVTTVFLLLDAPNIPARIERIMGAGSEKLAEISRMSHFMIDFVIVRTETNAVHGFLFGGSLWVMGIHGALLWGVLTFFLSYIPYLGLVLAAIPAIIFAYIQYGLWGVVAVIALVCFLNTVIENPIFSYFAARRFEIPALVVIVSTVFWGYVLGFFGLVFAVPITLLCVIVLQCSDELRWINILMGVDTIFANDPAGNDTGTASKHN